MKKLLFATALLAALLLFRRKFILTDEKAAEISRQLRGEEHHA